MHVFRAFRCDSAPCPPSLLPAPKTGTLRANSAFDTFPPQLRPLGTIIVRLGDFMARQEAERSRRTAPPRGRYLRQTKERPSCLLRPKPRPRRPIRSQPRMARAAVLALPSPSSSKTSRASRRPHSAPLLPSGSGYSSQRSRPLQCPPTLPRAATGSFFARSLRCKNVGDFNNQKHRSRIRGHVQCSRNNDG